MTSPSLLSRESTTLSPRWPQYGHFIRSGGVALLRLIGQAPHAAEVQAGLRRKPQPEQQRRSDGEQMQQDRAGHREIVGRAEKHRRTDAERLVESADGA